MFLTDVILTKKTGTHFYNAFTLKNIPYYLKYVVVFFCYFAISVHF